ncbi:MAG TPA: RhoGEF domain-containing protein [Waddliaceae bacterium]
MSAPSTPTTSRQLPLIPAKPSSHITLPQEDFNLVEGSPLPNAPPSRPAPPSPAGRPPSGPAAHFGKVLTEATKTEESFVKSLEKLGQWSRTMMNSEEKKIREFGEQLDKSVTPMLISARKLEADLRNALDKPGIRAQIDATAKAYKENSKSYFEGLKNFTIKQETFNAKFNNLIKKYPEQMKEMKKTEGVPDANGFQATTITPVQRGPRHELLLREMGTSIDKMSISKEETKVLSDAKIGVKQGNSAVNTEKAKMDLVGGYERYINYCEKFGTEKVDQQLSRTLSAVRGLELKISTFSNMINLAGNLNRGMEDQAFAPAAQKYLKENLLKQYSIEEMRERLEKMQDINKTIKNDPMDLKNSSKILFDERSLLSLSHMKERLSNTMKGIFGSLSAARQPPEGKALTKEEKEEITKREKEIDDAKKIIESAIDPESKKDSETDEWMAKPTPSKLAEALKELGLYSEPPKAPPAAQRVATKTPSRNHKLK